MAETVDQVEARIGRARHRIAADLHELEAKVGSATDWRNHVAKQPFVWLGAAFVAGFALARPSGRSLGRATGMLSTQTGVHTIDKFVGAFTVVAVDRAKDYLESRLPGFSRAFDAGHTS